MLTSVPYIGTMAFLFWMCVNLSSSGCTMTALHAHSSSGRVVAMGRSSPMSLTLKLMVVIVDGFSTYSISASAMGVLQAGQ